MNLITKYLFYSLLIFLPLGVLPRVYLIKSVYVYPADIVLLILNLLFFYSIIKRRILLEKGILKSLYAFTGFAFFTLLLNSHYLLPEQFLVSFLYLVRFVIYANLIFILKQFSHAYTKQSLIALSISGAVFTLIGLFQYFFYPDLRKLYYLGWDEHYYRLFSTLFDPNFTGAVLVLVLLFLMGIFKSLLSNINRIYYISIFLTAVAVFLTYSRSTFIMFLCSVLLFIILIKRIKYIIIFILLFISGIILLPKDIKSEGVDLLRTASVVARQNTYKNALTIFKDSPVFGVGFNTYRYAQKRYNLLDEKNWATTHPAAGVPNSFIFVLVTTGVIGLVLYLNLWRSILIAIIRRNNNRYRFLRAALISSVIGVFIHSLFENSLFYPFVMFWLFSFIGLFISVDEKGG